VLLLLLLDLDLLEDEEGAGEVGKGRIEELVVKDTQT
jgi:hypothetical protein